jgi:sugar/nucleoside kinase (ribokinase family)
MPDIFCLGLLVADVVGCPVGAYPARGELSLVETIELHSGGCAANTGVTLAKLGVSTGIIGNVGADGFGEFMISQFERAGVDTRGVRRDATAGTAATMVMVHPDAERSFIHYPGSNATLTQGDIDLDLVAEGRILHVAGSLLMPRFDGEPAAAVLRAARERGLITSLDTVWDATGRWMEVIRPTLPHLDYMLPSLEEARRITGREEPAEIARVFLDLGAKIVVIKCGEQGCYGTDGERSFTLPVYAVRAVDALGAGDAWVGGFLTGVLRGWDLEECARFGNAVGAQCVQALGATTGIRSEAETLEFMRRHAA